MAETRDHRVRGWNGSDELSAGRARARLISGRSLALCSATASAKRGGRHFRMVSGRAGPRPRTWSLRRRCRRCAGSVPRLCPTATGIKLALKSALLPSWYLAANPTHSILAATHNVEFAERWGRRVRNDIAADSNVFGISLSEDSSSSPMVPHHWRRVLRRWRWSRHLRLPRQPWCRR